MAQQKLLYESIRPVQNDGPIVASRPPALLGSIITRTMLEGTSGTLREPDPGIQVPRHGESSSESGICAIGGSARHPERQHHFARGLWNGADRYHPSARKVYATKMMMVFRGVRAQLQNQPCGHGRRHIQAVRPGGNCGQDDGGKFTAP
ncbi:hypothetical protein PENNAL_c0148G05309 [Penicillium nalgiovense]|uniref:Uncharacterized protein n=1 Tax=Penicillium nalgiovense TaxID=60175 RepID=A0A1V6X0L5_PENNA|nr:hypothetical protein PENNAL_c0148G05309 [Penicillium nalgiovense]